MRGVARAIAVRRKACWFAERGALRWMGSMLRVLKAVVVRCGLVGGDFCGAEIVELFDFGCRECAIVDADVVR
jgi:hypothetical protein